MLWFLPLLLSAFLIDAHAADEKKQIHLIWQSSKQGLWEVEWISELLSDFQVNEIVDGNYTVSMDKSIIVTGSYSGDYFSKLKEENRRFGVIHLSDEVYSHPTHFYDQSSFVFRNYWNKQFQAQDNVHFFALGYKQGLRQKDLSIPARDINQRDFTWSFAGGIADQPTRRDMIFHMQNIPNFHIHEIFTWNDPASLGIRDYSDLLLSSVFVPCPRGYWNLDSFRVYEALECGCIPIVEKQPLDYFTSLFGEHPFLSVNSWDEAPALIHSLVRDLTRLEQLRQKCRQWWLVYKAKTREAFRVEIERAFFGQAADVAQEIDFDVPSFVYAISPASLEKDLNAASLKNSQYLFVAGINDMNFYGESEKWDVIADFLSKHLEWNLCERRFDESGLVILERCELVEQGPLREGQIDEALKNRIILCTGPSFHRRKLLQETTEKDQKIIPFKKIFVSTNDPEIMDIEFPSCKTVPYLIGERNQNLDCLNSMITSIRNVALDPECLDEDIILYKHETVFINDMYLVRKAIGKLLEGHDMVIRYWTPDHFYMTDVFFMKVGAIREIFRDKEQVEAFSGEYPYCEVYFTKVLAASIPNIYTVYYDHLTRKDTELGFFHLPRQGEEHSEGYWDKGNYLELFK